MMTRPPGQLGGLGEALVWKQVKFSGLNSLTLSLGRPTVPGPLGQVGGARAKKVARWVQESPLSVQALITAGPTLLSQGMLTCQHSRREQPGPGSTWPCGSRAGSRAGGAGGRVPGHRHCTPPPHWSTVAPARPSWVGRGVCCMGSSEWEAGGKRARGTAGALRVGVGVPLSWAEPPSLSPKHWGPALLGL